MTDPNRPCSLVEVDEDVAAAILAAASREAAPRPHAPVASPWRPTARPPAALLTACDDGRADGEVVRLRGDRFVIGRTEGDFRLPHDPLVSTRHAEVTRQQHGGGVALGRHRPAEHQRPVRPAVPHAALRPLRVARGPRPLPLRRPGRRRHAGPPARRPRTVGRQYPRLGRRRAGRARTRRAAAGAHRTRPRRHRQPRGADAERVLGRLRPGLRGLPGRTTPSASRGTPASTSAPAAAGTPTTPRPPTACGCGCRRWSSRKGCCSSRSASSASASASEPLHAR